MDIGTCIQQFADGGLTTFLTVVILFLVAYWYLSMPKNLPPGPLGLPIVGYVPFMGKIPAKTFTKLGKKYGPIFSVYLGNCLVIVLNDFETIREAYIRQAEIFSGRPRSIILTFPDKYLKSIIGADGDFWKVHHKFITALLKDCGVGKLVIEPQIMEEINHFLAKVNALNGEATDLKDLLATSIANNICIMALGKRFEYGDPSFLKIKHLFDKSVSSSRTVSAINFFPWLRHIPGFQRLITPMNFEKMLQTVYKFLQEIVDEHRRTYVPGHKDNYISAYFTEQQQRLEKNKDVGHFDDQALLNNMRVLMLAGTETTTSTLLWAITYMMVYPEIQKKVQDELDAVIGTDRTPSWNDRIRTPYTEATIYEIQRTANLSPLNLPHRNIEECEVHGYKIPCNSYILSNLGNALSDPKLWGDPENFRPERFLSKTGEVQKPDYFIPFSTGKRECAGKVLARMELYLYFTTMLQSFTFKISHGDVPSLDGIYGTTHMPKKFVTCAISRHK